MMAIGAGAKAQVEKAFAAMGTNMLVILPGSTSAGGVQGGFGSMPTLTWDDLAAVRSEVSTVKAAAPALRSNLPIVSEEQNWTTGITGTSPEYFEIRSWPMSTGASFTQSDVDVATNVIVLGQTVVDKLFGASADPVGQVVRVGTTPFTVVGVAAKKGQSATGQDYDDAAFIPVTTFARKIQGGLGKYIQGSITVAAVSADATSRAQRDVSALLRDRHHIAAGADDDFSIRNLAEVASAQQQGTDTMTTLLASVAAVSLLVGGIGIMNIMLVSVTERTREIGVRMAVGAKPSAILAQFLVEALTLAIAGGILGVLVGVGTAQWLAARFGWPMLVQPDVIAVSVVFSATVGVVFGIFPAQKASRLDPIDALRFE
jgi:putative ABC transport system permease protein